MSAAWVIETVDVFEDGNFHIPSGLPGLPPDQFGFYGFEEGFHCGIIIAIALAAHGHLEPMLAQDFLIIVRTILAAAIRMMDATFGRPAQSYSHVQRPDRKVSLHST